MIESALANRDHEEAIMTGKALPDIAQTRQQLGELGRSAAFRRSERLFALLSFLVEETLAGRGATLKELVIGDALYSRSAPYDPRVDSTVRVEARRLRSKLSAYYNGPGRNAAVRILLPASGYTPIIDADRWQPPESVASLQAPVDLAVMPFRSLMDSPQDHLADGITDELMELLGTNTRLRLAPRLAIFGYRDRSFTVAQAASELGARALLHGILRMAEEDLSISLELSNPQGYMAWSTRIRVGLADSRSLEPRAAQKVMAHLPDWLMTDGIKRERTLTLVS